MKTHPRHHTNIRPALLADVPEIVALQSDLADYCGTPPELFAITGDHVARIIKQDQQAYYFVADAPEQSSEHQLSGMMLCHRVPLSWRGVSGVYIEDLYVRPEYRHGQGVGRLLMAQACRLAIELAGDDPQAAFIRLDTSAAEDNRLTLDFYDRLGMECDNVNYRLYGSAVHQLAAMASSNT